MRLANRLGRAVLLRGTGFFDLESRSKGEFGPTVMSAIQHWDEISAHVADICTGQPDGETDPAELGPCVPHPRNIIAVGMNYREHAQESGMEVPARPLIFTKFPNCLTGAGGQIELPSDSVDYEVELVLVIGREARNVAESMADHHIAGVTVGQDISDRVVQMFGTPPQFSLGKSLDTFGPIGPAVVSLDEIPSLSDLVIWCEVDGERLQEGNTSDLIFSPSYLISYLSRFMTLAPGDLIFTGTPAGVGIGFDPPRFLTPGSVVRSGIEGVGVMENTCVSSPPLSHLDGDSSHLDEAIAEPTRL